MTTYNTGNPLGSTAVQDLYDNAENTDNAANNRQTREWIDRLGARRRTLWGMEQDFQDFLLNSGYEPIGDYGSGLNITARNQIFRRDGEWYRAGANLELPYTTTGEWGSEGPLFVGAGDAVLRQELADTEGGANIVAYRSGVSVRQGLDNLELELNEGLAELSEDVTTLEIQGRRMFGSDLDAATIDMHFGVLRGRGWTAGDPPWTPEDPQNVHSTTATAAIGTTSTDIPVASSSSFTAGMLICYLGIDGRYYSAKLHEILSGPMFRLGHRLPQEIASGAPIYNFYRDNAHPNTYGGAAIVDDAISRLSEYRVRHIEGRLHDGLAWRPYNGGTVATYTTLSYGNPSETAAYRRSVQIHAASPGMGAMGPLIALEGGDYIASLPVNPGLRDGGFSGLVDLSVVERTSDGFTFTIATTPVFAYDSIQLVELPFSVRPGSTIQILATTPNSGGQTFWLGPISINRLGARIANINRGKHVLFGDSWFSAGSAMATRFIERLDKASVVVKGIAGNYASQLIERFTADVASEQPDYVWIMVGTNDYYANVPPTLFEQQILQLRRFIQSIGAQPIIFNASVGDITYSPQQLDPSRQYALRVRNESPAAPANGAGTESRNSTFFSLEATIPAGGGLVVGVTPAQTTGDAILRSLFVSSDSLAATLGYSSVVSGEVVVDPLQVMPSGAGSATNVLAPRSSDRDPRFVVLRLHNATGSPITTSFSADVCWTTSR